MEKKDQRSKNKAQLVDRKQATKVENKTGSHTTELIVRIFLALTALSFLRERAWLNIQIRKSQMYYLKTCLLVIFHSFTEDFKNLFNF